MTELAVRPWLAATLVAGCVAASAVAARTPFPGRFLFLVVAVATGVEAFRAIALRPTLRAGAAGIEVVRGFRRERLPWSAVHDVTTLGAPSGGGTLRRRSDALEIDLGDRLVVVPAYRLGTSAAEAAESITASNRTASRP